MRSNWKTTIGGTLTSVGAALMGAAALDWMTVEEKHWAMRIGFLLTVFGPVFHGMYSRDRNVSDQDAGLRPDPLKKPPGDLP